MQTTLHGYIIFWTHTLKKITKIELFGAGTRVGRFLPTSNLNTLVKESIKVLIKFTSSNSYKLKLKRIHMNSLYM
jgi:hypothetical protein